MTFANEFVSFLFAFFPGRLWGTWHYGSHKCATELRDRIMRIQLQTMM